MKLTSFLSAAFVTALTLSSTASAMSVDVDFSFSTVRGTLTFAQGIGDRRADAISFTSDNFGENSFSFSISGIDNSFSWSGASINSALLLAFNSDAPSLQLDLNTSTDFFRLSCGDRSIPPGCAGAISASISDTAASFVTEIPPSVPLPAGLPLVLTGLAGFAGLRMRKKRKAQV